MVLPVAVLALSLVALEIAFVGLILLALDFALILDFALVALAVLATFDVLFVYLFLIKNLF